MTNTTPTTTIPPNATGTSETANLAVLRRFVAEVINEANRDTIPEVIHPDYRYHGRDGEVEVGQETAWQIAESFRASFSDLNAQITSANAQGDRVTLTLVVTGTHDGDLMGIAPTGASIELPMTVVSRFLDLRIVEEWEDYDAGALIEQISSDVTPASAWNVEGGTDDEA